jgi:hypothetical protein
MCKPHIDVRKQKHSIFLETLNLVTESFNSYNLIKLNFILPNRASIEQHNILVILSINKYKNK